MRSFFDLVSQEWLVRFRRTSRRRPAGDPPDPQMAESRGDGGRAGDADGDRNAAKRGDLPSAGEYLSALRLRPLGATMARTPRPRCGHPRALRRRHRRRLRAQGRRRAVPGGPERADGAVRAHAASGKDAPHRVRPPCGGQPSPARPRQGFDKLSRRRSTSSGSRTSADDRAMAAFSFGGSPGATGCRPSCARSRKP